MVLQCRHLGRNRFVQTGFRFCPDPY